MHYIWKVCSILFCRCYLHRGMSGLALCTLAISRPSCFRPRELCMRLQILAKQTLALAGAVHPKISFVFIFRRSWRRLIFFNRAKNEWAKHGLWHWVMSLCAGEQTNNEISPARSLLVASTAIRKAPSSLDTFCNYSSEFPAPSDPKGRYLFQGRTLLSIALVGRLWNVVMF